MSGTDNPFRYCVFCKADCYEDEPEHADDCPQSTGVYPIREEDVLCHGCKKTYIGMRCSECHVEFSVGDHYTHRELDDIGGTPCYEPICIGCAAQELAA